MHLDKIRNELSNEKPRVPLRRETSVAITNMYIVDYFLIYSTQDY